MTSAQLFPARVEDIVHRHRGLLVGAGAGGLCVAARLRRTGGRLETPRFRRDAATADLEAA